MTEKFKETFIGSIPQEWDTDKLENLCKIITDGSHFSPKEYTGENGKIIATVKNMDDFGFNINSCKRICVKDYETLVKNGCKPEKGDVLFSKDGTIGLTFVYDDEIELVLLSSIAILKVNDRINPYFLKYYLQDKKTQDLIKSGHTSGSALPRIVLKDLKLLEVVVPPINEQELIIKHLLALDQKIELNHKMNHTLEKIGQAIFKHWFIDFEFPNEDGKPYKSSGGEMVDSELGEVPEGWEAGKLRDILSIEIGGDWGKDEEFDDSVKVICLRGVDLQKLKENRYSPEAPVRWISKSSLLKREISNCDILVGASGLGPVGRSIYFSSYINNLYDYPIIYSNFCKRLKAKNSAYAMYSEKIIDTIHSSGQIEDFVTGTSVPNLDFKGLLNYEIVIPPENILEQYASILNQKYKQLYKSENNILSQIRDSLLPKLMSGKIRLKGSETRENRKNINKRDQIPLKHEIHS